MQFQGNLTANGTLGNPIIFTSIKDDTWGGDTNGDGNATAPAPGDWQYLEIGASSAASSLQHCRFFYGGKNSRGVLRLYSGNATVANCEFGNTQGKFGLAQAIHANPSVSNPQFSNGDLPAMLLDAGTLTTGTFTLQKHAALVFVVIADISKSTAFHLTLQAGTIFKFSSTGGDLMSFGGNFTANGTDLEPIVFTSLKDDSWGGDTNGDGNATTPAPGDWQDIEITGTSTAGSLQHCRFFTAARIPKACCTPIPAA
ncbi:MAG: hypothetical protein IPM98_06310 [Lewinellaceae bacterium]|nr:hypothetical protein [Lewinellaceae bacterium]